MALPQVETGVIEMVAEEEAAERREKALANAAPAGETKAVDTAETKAVAVVDNSRAVAKAAEIAGANPEKFLAEAGFTDIKLDFTSFPTVTLNNQKFSTTENENFGDKFECVVLAKREVLLFRGDLGRDKEPELHYSSDGGMTDDKEGKPIADYIEDWKGRGIDWDRKEYTMVTVQMVDGPHADEICQIQVSPASRGKLGGYLTGLALRKKKPSDVVTQVGIGPTIGAGIKAFNPFTFKAL
jgi:hypothetical protein